MRSQGSGRVVGGETAPKPIPWMVNLLYRGKNRCGGTIIDPTTIITAGHCLVFEIKGEMQILADGTYQLDFDLSRHEIAVGVIDTEPAYNYPTSRIKPRDIIIHPNFIFTTKVSQLMNFSRNKVLKFFSNNMLKMTLQS